MEELKKFFESLLALGKQGEPYVVRAQEKPHPDSFHSPFPRVLLVLQGELVLDLYLENGISRVTLSPGEMVLLSPGGGFQHGPSETAIFMNLSLRVQGWVCRLREFEASECRTLQTGVIPAEVCPKILWNSFRHAVDLIEHYPYSPLAALWAMHSFIALLIDHMNGGLSLKSTQGGGGPLRWQLLCDIIGENSHLGIDRNLVARELHIHPNHVSRLCHEQGTTFVELLTRVRLEKACAKLLQGQAVGKVALACGFRTPQYFQRVFKQEMSVSPGVWLRNQMLSLVIPHQQVVSK